MVWRRLPTFFPNIPLRMLPLSEPQLDALRSTGWLREVAFRTQPNVNKLEIKAYLEAVYGVQVERVATINYLGRKHRRSHPRSGQPFYVRAPDWKKVYVTLRPPPDTQQQAQQ